MKLIDELKISVGDLLDYVYFYCNEVLAQDDSDSDFSGNINRKNAICDLRKRITYDLMSDDSSLKEKLIKTDTSEKHKARDFVTENSVDKGFLQDWYQASVLDNPPVWTDEYITEIVGDFYLIPKEVVDGKEKLD